MRKALQTEQGKGDMEGRIGTLEAEAKDFERQVLLLDSLTLPAHTRLHGFTVLLTVNTLNLDHHNKETHTDPLPTLYVSEWPTALPVVCVGSRVEAEM